jgi:hypothetical protein
MNTNEIQIRLTADIKALQSALTKAQKTIQDFESKNSSETEKSNKAKERQLGIIEKLNIQAKKLQVSIKQATSKEEIAKFNQELEKTKKQLSFLNSLGKGSSRPVGLINNLNAQLKTLKQSIAEATNEKDVARLNAELEKTQEELKRIQALGKSIADPAVKSFDKFRVSAGAANASAIAFNRIIQDAPFGIIGVGNNIQQFAEQLSALRITTGSTGSALKTFFSSLFTGSNLIILAVSAATAAFTAYQLGVFDSVEDTRDLNKELEDFKNTLDDVTKSQLEGAQSAQSEIQSFKLLKLQAENANLPLEKRILAVKELRTQYPDYLKGLSDEQILTGKVGLAYQELTTSIYAKAKAAAFSKQITESESKILALVLQEEERLLEINDLKIKKAKIEADGQKQSARDRQDFLTAANAIQENINELEDKNKISEEDRKKIAAQVLSIQSKLPAEIEKAGGLIDSNTESYKQLNAEVEKLKRTFEELINLPNGGLPREGDVEALRARFKKIQEGGITGQTGQDFINAEINKIKEAGIITEGPFSGLAQNFELQSDQIKLQVEDLAQVFTGLGSVIGRAFKNPQLGTFLGEFLRFAAQLVAANFKIAGSNAVVGASEAAKATGPAAPITLPAFIAGALGVVAAAFAAFGNFGSSGGGSASPGVGSTFTNREFGGPVSKGRAYIVGERRPELFVPNTNGIIVPQLPSMDYSGASMSAGAMAVDVNIRGVSYGDDILFTVQQAQIRRGLR